jgi:hypothetical protein
MNRIIRSAVLCALLIFALSPHHLRACTCTAQSVRDAKKNADVVFAGVVEEVTLVDPQFDWEPRVIVRFNVGRVWKGPVTQSFTMHTNFESSSCQGFPRALLETGHTLLVYGNGKPAAEWKGNTARDAPNGGTATVRSAGSAPARPDLISAVPDQQTLYTTDICTRSMPVEYAVEDFEQLGKSLEIGPLRALPDPAAVAATQPSTNGLPGKCTDLGDAKRWRKLPRPPLNHAELVGMMESSLYKDVPNPRPTSYRDFWVIGTNGKYGLCRTAINPDIVCGEAELEFSQEPRGSNQYRLEGRVSTYCN